MSAAKFLVIVENSGSLESWVTPALMMGLEAAADGERGCSYAFQRYDPQTGGVGVDFHMAGPGGLGAAAGSAALGASQSIGGGGGTYLNELFGQAVAEHAKRHGSAPETVVFWSDFIDLPPDLKSMRLSAQCLAGANVVCAVAGVDQNMDKGRRWATRLGELTGAHCVVVPEEALASWAEAKKLSASTAAGKVSAAKPGL